MSDDTPTNNPYRFAAREVSMLILLLSGLLLACSMLAVGGAFAGRAIMGNIAGGVAGGFFGFGVGAFLFEVLIQRGSFIECGCIAVMVCVLVFMSYFIARWFEKGAAKSTSSAVPLVVFESKVGRATT